MHKVVTSSIDPQIDIATHPADCTRCIGKEETLPFHVGRLTQKPQQRTMQMRRLAQTRNRTENHEQFAAQRSWYGAKNVKQVR